MSPGTTTIPLVHCGFRYLLCSFCVHRNGASERALRTATHHHQHRSLIASYLVNFFGIASAFTMLFHLSLPFLFPGRPGPISIKGQSVVDHQRPRWTQRLSRGRLDHASHWKVLRIDSPRIRRPIRWSIIVTLTSGIVVTSTIGIAIGEHIFSSAALIFSSDCVGNIGIVISSVGNGEPYSDIFLYAEI